MIGAKNNSLEATHSKEIKAMYIAPSYHRKGVGTLLLNNILLK